MILNVIKCPQCGGASFAVECKTWVNVSADTEEVETLEEGDYVTFEADGFDAEDADYAEPLEGGDIICRDCGHVFKNTAAKEASDATE